MQKFLRMIFCLLLVSTMVISLSCKEKEEAPLAPTEEVTPTEEVAPPEEAPPAEQDH